MTLDEQIAWLSEQACEHIRDAMECRDCTMFDAEAACREEASMLLTIENTLRAVRDAQR